jgi:hypothetical protein
VKKEEEGGSDDDIATRINNKGYEKREGWWVKRK